MRRLAFTTGIFLVAFLAACGGSDNTGPGSIDLPEAVVAGGSLHGTVRSIGQNQNAAVFAGDDANNVGYHGTLGFALRRIPASATVTRATLTVTQCNLGGNPFTVLGALVVDHIDMSSGLTDAAYSGETIAANIGTLSTTPDSGARTLDVTDAVRADLAARHSATAYRLRFADHDTNNDNTSDFVQIGLSRSPNCTGAPDPKLHVDYTR